MKSLLTVTALGEGFTGLVLAVSPSLLIWGLLGTSLDTPTGSLVGRVAGTALVALAISCWLARNDGQSRAARSLVAGVLFYSTVIVVLLIYAGIRDGLVGVGLWPAVLAHAALSAWCVALVWIGRATR